MIVKPREGLQKLFVPSELQDAWENLTKNEREMIDEEKGSISGIACKLGLTRSYVHSYIRARNLGNA